MNVITDALYLIAKDRYDLMRDSMGRPTKTLQECKEMVKDFIVTEDEAAAYLNKLHNPENNKVAVIWADGTYDNPGTGHRNTCVQCQKQDCRIPVHPEQYRILIDGLAQQWDTENPVI